MNIVKFIGDSAGASFRNLDGALPHAAAVGIVNG
jgi:hypothetical protein